MDNYSLQKPLNMAPTGIATFAKSDLATDIYHLNADVAVLGAPFDLAIQGSTGCRLGPRGIRLGSTRFTYKKGGTYDSERKQYYMDARRWHVVDCGDVDYIPGDLKGTMANLESAVSIIQKQGALPVVLGGDCAVDFPVLQGLEGIGNFDIVHIDAHLDWTKPLDGQKFFNGSPMRNAAGLPYVGRILHLGVRGIGSSGPDDFEEAREHGDQIYSCRDVRRLGIDRILKEFGLAKQFVVCFDIDAMDAVYAPATGSPMFGGFNYDEAVDILEAIGSSSDLKGIVMTEVAPPFDDIGGTTGYLAARLISDLLGFAMKRKEALR